MELKNAAPNRIEKLASQFPSIPPAPFGHRNLCR